MAKKIRIIDLLWDRPEDTHVIAYSKNDEEPKVHNGTGYIGYKYAQNALRNLADSRKEGKMQDGQLTFKDGDDSFTYFIAEINRA